MVDGTMQRGNRTLSIPHKATIQGGVDFAGPVVNEGTILGDVHCGSLVVAERGIVAGTIRAEAVTIMGEVTGEVYANYLTLKTACFVAGDIFHKHLALEDGCFFEGKSRRHASPLKLPQPYHNGHSVQIARSSRIRS
jgi:cytoskeletal protein CcmA (bactofilin family)